MSNHYTAGPEEASNPYTVMAQSYDRLTGDVGYE